VSESQLVYEEVVASDSPQLGTLIVLHGYDGTSQDLISLARSAASKFTILAPQAARGVWDDLGASGYSWYGNQQIGLPEPASLGDSLLQLELFVYEALDRQTVDRHLPYLLGYDQGAVVALTQSLVIPDLLAGVISICGYLPRIPGWDPPNMKLNELPILFVSDADGQEIPSDLEDWSIQQLRARGASVEITRLRRARDLGAGVVGAIRDWLATSTS